MNNASNSFAYDLTGNVIQDPNNHYVYDREGRICAVWSPGPVYTQYVYDAEGNRVARGAIPASDWPATGATCNAPTAAKGFTPTSIWLRSANGGQDTQIYYPGQGLYSGVGAITNTNVYADGSLLATYSFSIQQTVNGNVQTLTPTLNLSFAFSDWLGSKRLQINSAGQAINTWASDPFGNYLTPGAGGNTDATDRHFTGKERDTESGLDYFGARYYSSSMGRFSSPDPSGAAFSDPGNPQSWNMYSYVQNSPLNAVDPDGLDCVYINGDGQMTGFNRGDCDNSTTEKANSGYYFDGTVNTIYTTTGDTSGQVVGVQGTSDETGGQLYQANPAGLSFGQPNASSSTSGMTTTIDTWGDYSQTTQFNTGTRPFRNNSPGDLEAKPFSLRHGQIGKDGRFAVFPSAGVGGQALHALLAGPSYFNLSINDAVTKYAPSLENNTAGYQQFLTNVLQASGSAPLSSLSPAQFQKLENAIAQQEGFNARGNYSISVTTNF